MNILRMIKLFAWESKVKENIMKKREDELDWSRKGAWLHIINVNLK